MKRVRRAPIKRKPKKKQLKEPNPITDADHAYVNRGIAKRMVESFGIHRLWMKPYLSLDEARSIRPDVRQERGRKIENV